ncbi:UNVERIFIED_CONTAM: hypothetical protein K2H54_061245 [Gekko kuhli]
MGKLVVIRLFAVLSLLLPLPSSTRTQSLFQHLPICRDVLTAHTSSNWSWISLTSWDSEVKKKELEVRGVCKESKEAIAVCDGNKSQIKQCLLCHLNAVTVGQYLYDNKQ